MSSLDTDISESPHIAATAYIPFARYKFCCNHQKVRMIYKKQQCTFEPLSRLPQQQSAGKFIIGKPSTPPSQVRHRFHFDTPIIKDTLYEARNTFTPAPKLPFNGLTAIFTPRLLLTFPIRVPNFVEIGQ
jgi:hypothetical protein